MANKAKWDLPEDPRKQGLKYPNYNIVQTPSGHTVTHDDTKGQESITYQHRSGSLIQFQPDGSIAIIAKKSRYNVVFGDDNVMITGGQNVTINGGAQLKVEGDYDLTVNGNMKATVQGNFETIVNGDMTTAIKGQSETVVGGDQSTKVAGNSEYHGENAYMGAEGKLGLKAHGGNVDIDAGGNTNVGADGNIAMLAGGDITHDQG